MAYTELYVQTTGNDANAGSTTADSAAVTSTNGDWGNAAANRFTAAAGTPFSGVSVGDYASIYLDGATVAVYVAQVTAVNAGGASIDLSSSIKYGTAPSTGASGRSCKMGGAWASAAAVASIFASVTVPQSTRVNWKAGTYANTTTARSIASAGATTTPLWFRGYKTAIGDMDGVPTSTRVDATDIPLISFTTGNLTAGGTHQIWSNFSVTSACTTATTALINGGNQRFHRCRFNNTGANALSSGARIATSSNFFLDACWFKATSTATQTFEFARTGMVEGCTFEGGGSGIGAFASGINVDISTCVFLSNGSHGINYATAGTSIYVVGCTFYAPTTDGIRWAAIPSTQSKVGNNIFYLCGGWGQNNNTGTNTNIIHRFNNRYSTNTSGNETGFGDSPTFNDQADSNNPVTSSTDMTPSVGDIGRGNALPALFENESFSSHLDIGAVQHADSGGGATTVLWMEG